MDYEEFQEILYGDHEDYVTVGGEVIEHTSRWSIYYSQVFKQKSTGKFFQARWGRGATEMQEGQEHNWSFSEVEQIEKVVFDYKKTKDGISYEGFD